jgi:hypothetical protein
MHGAAVLGTWELYRRATAFTRVSWAFLKLAVATDDDPSVRIFKAGASGEAFTDAEG